MIQNVHVPVLSGLISSSSALLILDSVPSSDLATKTVLVGLAGVLTTFLTTTTLDYLNKLKKLPEKEVFDRHVSLLESVNKNLGEFLAGHEQWKHDIERRISDLEDVT